MKALIRNIILATSFLPLISISAEEVELTVEENLEAIVEGQITSPYTNFCQKRFLKEKNGKLYCNWGRSFGHACSITFPNNKSIEKGSVISGPKTAGKCSDGQVVVKLQHH